MNTCFYTKTREKIVVFFVLFLLTVFIPRASSQSTIQPTQVGGSNSVQWDQSNNKYQFLLNGVVLYEYQITNGNGDAGTFSRINAILPDDNSFLPSFGGGLMAMLADTERYPWNPDGHITLVNEYQSYGYKSVQFDASQFPSGVYIYRIQAGTFTDVKKMILLK